MDHLLDKLESNAVFKQPKMIHLFGKNAYYVENFPDGI